LDFEIKIKLQYKPTKPRKLKQKKRFGGH